LVRVVPGKTIVHSQLRSINQKKKAEEFGEGGRGELQHYYSPDKASALGGSELVKRAEWGKPKGKKKGGRESRPQ